MIEDNACYISRRISDVYGVEHSRMFENRLKITLGRISSHVIIAFLACVSQLKIEHVINYNHSENIFG